MRHQPQHVTGARDQVRIALVYKNTQTNRNVSHVGLGVTSLLTQRTLLAAGYHAETWAVDTPAELHGRLAVTQATAASRGQHPVSHVIIAAPWIATTELQKLIAVHHDVQWVVECHSNFGFLQADPAGARLMREAASLDAGSHNFRVAGNCSRFVNAWATGYGGRMLLLPNLYDVSTIVPVGQRLPWSPGHTLRVGVFGAVRPLKNHTTAVAAAIQLAAELRNDVEVHVSAGRVEGGGVMLDAVGQLAAGVPGVRLVPSGWRSWPDFRQLIGTMHVLLQPSFTESFNVVSADGVASGVASAVGEAIDWVPRDWKADADDAGDVARVARRLLHDAHAVTAGQTALRKYVADGLVCWERYLTGVA